MEFTIFGSNGFIGRNLVEAIKKKGYYCFCPVREYKYDKSKNLGHVIYAIGLTSDFREKPFETVEAHVCKLKEILKNCNYESFLYLSSTRVYSKVDSGSEYENLKINPNNFDDIYNISKVLGESLCLSIPNKKVRVIRISNVIGNNFSSNNFLYSVIKDAILNKRIFLAQSMNIRRDYITIDDVIYLIMKIIFGKNRLYNVASGNSISNRSMLNFISEKTGAVINNINDTTHVNFPTIDISNIQKEFRFIATDIFPLIDNLIYNFNKT